MLLGMVDAEERWRKINTTGYRHNEISLCTTRAGDVHYRLRERKERGIPARYDDYPKTAFVMRYFRAKHGHWLPS